MSKEKAEEEVFRFILDEIETVPHLEALLLLWNSRPKRWGKEELSERLFTREDQLTSLMQDLVRRRLVVAGADVPNQYWYESQSPEMDWLIEAVAATYQHQLVRISTLIHSKAAPAVREFAKAFKFTKEKEKE
jgi:hypothetical protein